ncbi:pilus assembly protein [Aurantiacibacter sp. MUD11]|uniref:TadE/TadG family type IV pilus assembly protein n=1 Tax=Aurantiacibacter sp. MUD11 TaxID=3003265 RepID=UPI0022AA283C|nr:TadE/TadG family type IV pilus assembly protein [Aurantiacibacter sp. MUD11]WAT18421.1 pilus assembly protein [Aurantiacibacter sp. MUD11]
MRALALQLVRDDEGVTVAEFALLAPVLCMTLMGLFDLTYNFYADTMIEGAVQEAARDSTIEGYATNPAALDRAVERAVHNVVPGATLSFSRKAYTNYIDIGEPEEFTDTNSDGTCNDNEPFEDSNGNGQWDQDRSKSGSSGARDAVLYEVSATFDRAFPLPSLLAMDPEVTVRATTVLRNQPYSLQDTSVRVGNCL